MCVTDESLSAIRKAVGSLREKRLLGLRESGIKGVQIESGNKRLVLDYDKSEWRNAAYIGKKDAVAKGEADTDEVEQWFEKLKGFEMTASIPGDETVWRKTGIDKPQVVIRFIRTEKVPRPEEPPGPARLRLRLDANESGTQNKASSGSRISWAWLLKRVFKVDITGCPRCSG